jgi:hypothetical protein
MVRKDRQSYLRHRGLVQPQSPKIVIISLEKERENNRAAYQNSDDIRVPADCKCDVLEGCKEVLLEPSVSLNFTHGFIDAFGSRWTPYLFEGELALETARHVSQ